MSHFTVLVTKTNKTALDEQLAPFDENIEMPRYVKYTREQLIAKERAEFEEFRDTAYTKFLADPVAYKASTTNERHLEYIEHKFPQRFNWTDEDFYKESIKYDDKENLTPEGGVHSTYNPKSKWDWYKVGGRWAGYFKIKAGRQGIRGNNGLMNSYNSEDGADIALVKNIDWEAMTNEKRERAERAWTEYEAKLTAGEKVDPYWDYGIEKDDTKETYIKRKSATATFAVLHDGEWYEKGEMGWWGMVSNEKSSQDWQAKFDEIISSLDPEDEITVVDAHI